MPYDNPHAPFTSCKIRDGRPQLDFDHYLPFGLTAISNKISRSASRAYLQRFGVGINEWRILSNLRVRPGTTANVICQYSGLDKAAVSRSIKLLEDDGMLATCDARPETRGRNLRLTAEGDAMHDRIIGVALEREELLLTGFSDAERRLLLLFVGRLHANVPIVLEFDRK